MRIPVYACLLCLASLWFGATSAAAQDPVPPRSGLVVLSGTVIDSLGRPIEDADVSVQQLQRRFRTGADGKFVFDNIKPGKYTVTTRRIGYLADSRKVTVGDGGLNLPIPLKRAAFSLPSVITTAERGGLSGVIADTGFRAMAGVKVRVLGTPHTVESDSSGAFFAPVSPGHYLVEILRDGYTRQLISVTVPPDAGRKIAAWMVPQVGRANPKIGANLFDMTVRLRRVGPVTAQYFTREDIEKAGWTDLRQVGSVAAGRLLNPNCPVIIDGGPSIRELWEITTSEVEFVETYTHRAPVPKANDPRAGDVTVRASTNMLPPSVCGTTLIVWLRH